MANRFTNRRGARNLRALGGIALAASLAFCGCDKSEPAKPHELTTVEWLDACSPFESFDAVRTLHFRISDQTVELQEAVDEERAEGALLAQHPKIVQGVWAANQAAQTVEVDLGGVKITYKLVFPTKSDQCILVVGSTDAADLSRSWFGTADFSPDAADLSE
jgi:hypothetical protein